MWRVFFRPHAAAASPAEIYTFFANFLGLGGALRANDLHGCQPNSLRKHNVAKSAKPVDT
jgi:hypothetical protein